jgi:hypothetical protein
VSSESGRLASRADLGYPKAMARVEIPLPDSFPFSTEIPVRITDLNYRGVRAVGRVTRYFPSFSTSP